MSRNLRLARSIYKKSQKNRSVAFCTCKPEIGDQCICGENVSSSLNWTWNRENITEDSKILIEEQNVLFHPIFSQGSTPFLLFFLTCIISWNM